ncbi:MAG: iron-containing alcohol dehydrogenase, partial [Anaerotignum sp.]|nr:iron-containing alcohol dehydrogenase [Anaerotignum sp.]
PVGSVLTIAAAGSEMSDSAVLTNEELGKKAGLSTVLNRPKFAIMNPELTFTLPKYQIACGITDIMMHTMERYFIPESNCQMTDEIAEGLLRTVIANGRKVMEDPCDYNAMCEVVWCGSLSHNGITGLGRDKDFSVHKFGHALGAKYDYAHGATLACVWEAWAKYLYMDGIDRFARFAEKVWGVTCEDKKQAAEKGIQKTVDYFREIGMPTNLREIGVENITDGELMELALDATMGGTVKLAKIKTLDVEDVYVTFENAK